MRRALEAARHSLTTLHGLHAHDGDPNESWRLDESAVLGQIDAALQGGDAALRYARRVLVEAEEECPSIDAEGAIRSIDQALGLSAMGEERSQ